jgi:hypothetical protein
LTSHIILWYLSEGVDVYYKYYEYTVIDILLILLCSNGGSVGIACSSPLNIFIHVIPEDGPYGPCLNKGHAD